MGIIINIRILRDILLNMDQVINILIHLSQKQYFNFIDHMSFLYRKHRTNTQRNIHTNFVQNMQRASTVTNNIETISKLYHSANKSEVSSKQKHHHLKRRLKQPEKDEKNNDGTIPVAYFFDKDTKKQIIKNLIDSYFDFTVNPQALKTQFHLKTKINPKTNRTCIVIPSKQKIFEVENKNKYNFAIKDVSKTQQVKFFTHRSFVQSNNNKNLPIISEDTEVGQVRRPISQQKSRYVSPQIALLKRRPSGGQLLKKQSQRQKKTIEKESQLFSQNTESQLAQSLVFNNTISNTSKVSMPSTKSYVKKYKYYSIKYPKNPKQSIIKQFNHQGSFLLSQEKKIKKIGAKTLWDAYPYQNQLVLIPHQPLNKQLYHRVPHMHGQEQMFKIYIHGQVYEQLFKNNCQWFRDIIVELSKQLIHLQGKVIINKLTLDNICRLEEKDIRVIDWSGSAIKQRITTVDKINLIKLTQPKLRETQQNSSKNNLNKDHTSSVNSLKSKNPLKWICQPEYLAPQIIKYLKQGEINQSVLWSNNSSASDVWSLGCLVFQILTLIPLNAQQRYLIKGRSYCRRGILSTPQFSYQDLQHKQRLFSTQNCRIVMKQCQSFLSKVDLRILNVMEKMLTFNRQKRIKPQQIINTLLK